VKAVHELSDEELLSMGSPADAGIAPATPEEKAADAAAAAGAEVTGDNPSDTGDTVEGGATAGDNDGSTTDTENGGADGQTDDTQSPSGDTDSGADGVTTGSSDSATGTAVEGGDQAPVGEKPTGDAAKDGSTAAAPGGESTGGQTSEPDYKAVHAELMAPLKANGKTITFQDPSELRQLAQMGANYTRRMQEIAPHRKMVTMLANNQIDESKLDFLIALDKGDPEAVKKLLADKSIDPLEIDTTKTPDFQGGMNVVTDDEVAFRTQLDDLNGSPEGKATITEVNRRFDDASKEILWKSPEIMTAIHEQRATGVYDLVLAEMDRQITLGKIQPNTPFIQAYKVAGDYLVAQAGNQGGAPNGQAGQPAPVVVTTRTAAPKPAATNGDKAAAASASRSSPATKQPIVNPLALSDDDFLKKMEGRL
jgi:hypothetical protein